MSSRILVAEDSRAQAEALRALLESHGHTVVVARSGEEALQQLQDSEFDLLLSDIAMPGMSGYDLCRTIKQDPVRRSLPVVLLTGLSDPMDIVRGVECGADNYITKPYDPEHLLTRLRHVLDNRRLRRAAASSMGITVHFLDREITITSEKEQILDLFLSSVEDVIRANEALQRSQKELAEAHAHLEAHARRMTRQAEVSTQRYQALLHNAGDAIFITDPQGRILEANGHASEMLGLPADQLAQRTLADLVDEAEREELLHRVASLGGEWKVHLGERLFLGADGRRIWCDLTASLTPLDEERLVLLIAHDVTQRRQAEEALQSTNRRLQALVEASPLAIVLLNRRAEVKLWNPAAERIFGWTAEEALGRAPPMVPEACREEFHALHGRVLQGEALAGVEVRRLRKDGVEVDISVSAAPLRNASGEIDGVIGLMEDISLRKQAEQAVGQREEAERANRAKSEFLSRMSHELRTPLNAILGFAQLLQLDPLDADQSESVKQILSAGRHLCGLIDEMLDLAKIEAGKLELSLEPVSAAEVVRDAVGLIQPAAAARRIQIDDADAQASPTFVRADSKRLKQVLLNFLSNAVKYNRPQGRVQVTVSRAGADRLRISVSDTGRGIPPEKMARLFVAFDRLEAEQGGVEGTGLGLVLSKALAEVMGGSVGVESVVGEGSTFWVELPAAERPDHVSITAAPRSEPLPVLAQEGRTRKVLYIEDNLANLRLVERLLAPYPGVRLLPAMQGRIGLELAQEHRPDLVLLDLNLPDLPGEQVLRRLRQAPGLREVPVVVISANAMPDQVEHLLRAGARDYLTKPLDVGRFLEVVDACLHGARPDAEEKLGG